MKYLYHITTKENLRSILTDGEIKPSLSCNSKIAKEDTPRIYLCKYKDLPYWKQLLGRCNTLRIPIEDLKAHDLKIWTYSFYTEYYTEKPIKSKHMQTVYCAHPTAESNKKLCLLYIWELCHLCVWYTRYYHKQTDTPLSDIKIHTENILLILHRLDYKQLTKEDYQEIITELIDSCAYTFADFYNNTNKRLWEQLICYPKDESTDCRQQLHNFIKTNLTPILYINTGGWCE